MQITEYDKARFWSRVCVKKQTLDFSGGGSCWIWKGSFHQRDGRGQFTIGRKRNYAPRIAWEIFNGDIPSELFVCHICDNPKCVNPRHLFLGTGQQNQEDAAKKLRKNNKMTPEVVREIRAICVPYDTNFGYSALGRKYHVNPASIWQVHKGVRWKHVA